MGVGEIIAIAIISLVLCGAVLFIVKSLKSGKKCIGCSGKCDGCNGQCCNGQTQENTKK